MNIKSKFIEITPRVPGVLYEPEKKEDKSKIGILIMHSDENYLAFPTGYEMAQRGYHVLCANVKSKEGMFWSQMDKMEDVRDAIIAFKNMNGIRTIILMGHSGGGTLMSAYQNLAENGVSNFQNEDKIFPYPIGELDYPKADGIMLLDSNWGNAAMQLFSLDPAVINEFSGKEINPRIDLFNPINGFDPKGSVFNEEFIRKFQMAQGKRNNDILKYALERLEAIEKGRGNYEDDEPFIIPGAAQGFRNNKLFAQDIRLMSHTQDQHKLLHAKGYISYEVVNSVRHPENPISFTGNLHEGARIMTVKNYLSSYAVRVKENYGYDEDSVWGIDWDSTYNCPPGNVQKIRVPTLVMGMTAGWEYLASETIFNMSGSEDKDIAFVEGATHKFTPAKECELVPGQYGDTMETIHNYIDDWLSKPGRFL